MLALMLHVAALAGATAGIGEAPAASGRLTPDMERERSLQLFAATLFESAREDPDFGYSRAWVDLDSDGQPEAIVRASSGAYCGRAGCTLFVLKREPTGLRQVSRTTITNPPVMVLSTSTNGWRDLSVLVRGGGVVAHHAKLAFDGRTYPSNPSVPPTRELADAPEGEILISDESPRLPLP